jgi:hypothetical protein
MLKHGDNDEGARKTPTVPCPGFLQTSNTWYQDEVSQRGYHPQEPNQFVTVSIVSIHYFSE